MNLPKSQRKGLVILFAISLLLVTFVLLSVLSKKVLTPEFPKINALDTLQLTKISGIGKKRAKTLRNYLLFRGKPDNPLELTEIYNFDSASVKKVFPYLSFPETSLPENFHPLNLNSVSYEQLRKTSLLPPFLVSRLIRFRQKIGEFENWEEVKKVYGISEKQIKTLQKYFYIKPLVPKTQTKPKKRKYIIIELNSANEQELQTLPGIGKVLAKRIVKYRNLLGGYTNIKQLKEVYGLSEDTYRKIKNKVRVSPENIRKILVNQATAYELMKHPYLSKKLAYRIVKYRKKYGNYQKPEDLKKIYGLSDSLFAKLKPYLEIR